MKAQGKARATLFSLLLVTLFSTAGIALPYPILAPLFLNQPDNPLTQFAGLDPTVLLGIILAIYPLGILIGSSFIGTLSDHFGRKRILIWSLVVGAAGYALSAWALLQQDYLLFAASRLLTGICEGNISIARALAADLHPTIDRTRSFSLIYTMGYAGWLVGPLAGGYLMPLGVDIAFWVAMIATLVCLVLVLFTIPADQHSSQPAPSLGRLSQIALRENSFALLRYRALWPVFWIQLLLTLGLNAFYEFYPVWLVARFDFDSTQLAHSNLALTAAMILCSVVVVTKVASWIGTRYTILTGIASLALLLALLPLMQQSWIWLILPLMGIAIALYSGLFPAMMSERYGALGEGKVQGLHVSTFCLANVIIALFGGVLAAYDPAWTLELGAALVMLAAFGFAWWQNRDQEQLEFQHG